MSSGSTSKRSSYQEQADKAARIAHETDRFDRLDVRAATLKKELDEIYSEQATLAPAVAPGLRGTSDYALRRAADAVVHDGYVFERKQ